MCSACGNVRGHLLSPFNRNWPEWHNPQSRVNMWGKTCGGAEEMRSRAARPLGFRATLSSFRQQQTNNCGCASILLLPTSKPHPFVSSYSLNHFLGPAICLSYVLCSLFTLRPYLSPSTARTAMPPSVAAQEDARQTYTSPRKIGVLTCFPVSPHIIGQGPIPAY